MAADNGLFYKQKNVYDLMNDAETAECFAYSEAYMKFLTAAKTERLAVREAVRLAEERGFVPFEYGKKYAPGARART